MAAFSLYALFDIKPQLTPVVSLAVLVDVIILFAMKDLLMPGVIFAYLLSFALFGIAVSALFVLFSKGTKPYVKRIA